MTTAIGHKMMGQGVKYHTAASGNGLLSHAASVVINHLGHAAVNKLARYVEGDGFKLTGEGRHHNVGRPKAVNKARWVTPKPKKPKTHKKK